MYKCVNCNNLIEKMDPSYVRCPFCASRIVFKARPPVAKEVKTD
ncbi:MAG: DNA-directed RNA polymerase subunit P [Candidatus Micrarchaeota archaeon]|nr:DNA-directed RNA polymerase subunit P [Candidatus Micrarchaeota archaeon]